MEPNISQWSFVATYKLLALHGQDGTVEGTGRERKTRYLDTRNFANHVQTVSPLLNHPLIGNWRRVVIKCLLSDADKSCISSGGRLLFSSSGGATGHVIGSFTHNP